MALMALQQKNAPVKFSSGVPTVYSTAILNDLDTPKKRR